MNPVSPELSRRPFASPASPPDDNPRKRARTACTRCKNRKQKCDGQWPVCSNCQKAGVECDKVIVVDGKDVSPAQAAYTRALEDRIAFLESRLSQQQHQAESQPTPATSTSPTASRNGNALGEVVEFLNLGNFEAPAYVGSGSGLSLAVNLGEMVQATVWNKALPTPGEESTRNPLSPRAKARRQCHGQRAITIEDLRANSAGPPGAELSARLVNAYLTRLHSRYPFLDATELWRLHDDDERLASARHIELSKAERFGIFKLYLVYAIGAMLLQLTEKIKNCSPEGFYMTALQHISAAREPRTVQNIEAMTLLVIYHLRSASSHGMWYMIGLAMRTCVDLGLHRKSCEDGLDHFNAQLRRRLFWTVYSLERTIAVSLGRPFSIPDRHIDIDLPMDTVDQNGKPTLSTAISLFQYRRIESRIHNSIYRADRPLSTLRNKLDKLYRELEDWRVSLLRRFSGQELDYPMLHYNRGVRILIQPFLAILVPDHHYYRLCVRAAGDVCQTHKRLHQSLDYGHSFIAVQTVFVAGITLLYCLWTAAHRIWSVTLSNDIRACSSVLFVMGERASWVKKYRDAFEILVNATMEKLETSAAATIPTEPSSQASKGIAQPAAAHASIAAASAAFIEQQGDKNDDAMRMVMELANWIDHEGTTAWMPDFENLENLSGQFPFQ